MHLIRIGQTVSSCGCRVPASLRIAVIHSKTPVSHFHSHSARIRPPTAICAGSVLKDLSVDPEDTYSWNEPGTLEQHQPPQQLLFTLNLCGSVPSPFNPWLIHLDYTKPPSRLRYLWFLPYYRPTFYSFHRSISHDCPEEDVQTSTKGGPLGGCGQQIRRPKPNLLRR